MSKSGARARAGQVKSDKQSIVSHVLFVGPSRVFYTMTMSFAFQFDSQLSYNYIPRQLAETRACARDGPTGRQPTVPVGPSRARFQEGAARKRADWSGTMSYMI